MRGSVVKRGAGYSVKIELNRNPVTGKRQQKWHSGYRTKKEAEKARVDLLAKLDHGVYVAPAKQTLADFLLEWMDARATSLKPTTAAAYADIIRAHIVPRIGSVPLQKVDGALLDRFYGDLLRDGRRDGRGGLAPKTVRNIDGVLNKAFRDALRWQRVIRNPVDAATPPSKQQTETPIWSPAQLRAFLSHVTSDRHFALYVLAATTGLRRGELAGLRWDDVDLETSQIRIVEARVIAGSHPVTGSPKSARSRRTIGVDPVTVTALRAWRKLQAEERLAMGSGWPGVPQVFTDSDGQPVHPQRMTRHFNAHVRSAGLPTIRLHDVRHSYATAALAAGERIEVVSRRLGHANVSVTMNIYAHVTAADDVATAERVAASIFGGG